MKKLLLLLLSLILVFSFAACAEAKPEEEEPEDPGIGEEEPGEEEEEEEEETVQKTTVKIDYSMYDENDDAVVEFVEVEIGSLLVKPAQPSNPHYSFVGWYNSDGGERWNFDTDTVTNDTSIYAVWEAINYTVTFVAPFDIDPHVYSVEDPFTELPDDDYVQWDIEGFYADENYTKKFKKLPEPTEVFEDFSVYVKATYIPFQYVVRNNRDSIEGNEEVEISGLNDASYTEITIPATIKGMPVVKFSFEYGNNKDVIKKVTVPGALGAIYAGAFNGLTALEEVIIEEGVTKIEYDSFFRCTSLTDITIPESVTSIESRAFYDCTSLASISAPGKITSMGSDIFFGCTSLVRASFKNAEVIGGFENNDSIEMVEVGSALHTVDNNAFYRCTSLKELKLASGSSGIAIKNVKHSAFYGCTSLESVGSLASLEAVDLYAFANCTSFMKDKTLDISKLDKISDSAFTACPIKNIVFSPSLTTIEAKAFLNCDSLEGFIRLPASLTTVGDNVFSANDNVKIFIEVSSDTAITSAWWYQNINGKWHTGVKRVYADAYFKTLKTDDGVYIYSPDNNNLAYVSIVDFEPKETDKPMVLTVPEKIDGKEVKRIDKYAFEGCGGIARIILPDTIYNIGDYAFYDCGDLIRVHIDTIVERIGNYAFAECEKLEFAYIAAAELGSSVFRNTALTTLYIYGSEDNEGRWDNYWHGGAYFLTDTVYGVYLTDDGLLWKKATNPKTHVEGAVIVGHTYNSDHTLSSSLSIPSKVKAFNENTEYTVFKIGNGAFSENSRIEYVSIPNTVIDIGSDAFFNCENLQYNEYKGALYIGSAENPYMLCVEAASFSIETLELHPDTRFIGAFAFLGCTDLREVSFPDGLVYIGSYAFNQCKKISELTIPDSVETIEMRAFEQCYGIQTLTIGAVEEIGYRAFYECGTMSLTLGEGIINIAERAFEGCNLESCTLIIPNSVKSIGAYAFHRISHIGGQTHKIVVGNGIEYLGRYALCSGGGCLDGGFEDDYAYYLGSADNPYLILVRVKDTSLTSFTFRSQTKFIYDDAFAGCTSLCSINIPSNIIGIGSYAFSHCTSLESVTLKNGLLYIGDSAFNGCTALTSLRVPESVKLVETEAFKGCTSLERLYLTSAIKEIGYNICVGCDNVTIYCTAKEKPSYWRYDWNACDCEVVWNYGN